MSPVSSVINFFHLTPPPRSNWYFRIAIHAENGKLRFEHPTLAGVTTGGWMERMKAEGRDILKPTFRIQGPPLASAAPVEKAKEVSMVKEGVDRLITMEELKAHSDHANPWFVVDGQGESCV